MPASRRILIGLASFMVLCYSCTSYTGKSFVPTVTGYPETQHDVIILNDDLLEISGLAYMGADRFAAINDEDGELFFVNVKKDSIAKYRFKGKGDYEEVVKVDSTFYVLESTGDIIEIPAPYTKNQTYKFGRKSIEFESMVYYPKQKKLVLIMKDRKKNRIGIVAYAFDLNTKTFDLKPFFTISFKEIFTMLTNYNAECKPSGAAINPKNNKLYIIAAVGSLLLQCTQEGKLEKIYKINPTHFAQPEGITFADNGDMYISNEGADGKATILKFPYGGPK